MKLYSTNEKLCVWLSANFSEQYLVCVWNLENMNILFGRWKCVPLRFSWTTKPVQMLGFFFWIKLAKTSVQIFLCRLFSENKKLFWVCHTGCQPSLPAKAAESVFFPSFHGYPRQSCFFFFFFKPPSMTHFFSIGTDLAFIRRRHPADREQQVRPWSEVAPTQKPFWEERERFSRDAEGGARTANREIAALNQEMRAGMDGAVQINGRAESKEHLRVKFSDFHRLTVLVWNGHHTGNAARFSACTWIKISMLGPI